MITIMGEQIDIFNPKKRWTGGGNPDAFMVSFGLMVLFTGPGYIVFFVLNARRHAAAREKMDLLHMVTWLIRGAAMAGLFLYFGLGITGKLRSRGIRFSANDMLHIGLIPWMLFIGCAVAKHVREAPSHQ